MSLGAEILALARQSLEDPRAGVRRLLSLDVPMGARTLGLLLMAVATALLLHIGFLLLPPEEDPLATFMAESPLRAAAIQWVILAVSVGLIYRIGRAWGGKGSLPDTLLVVVWLQVIMIGLQVLQTLALLVAPAVASVLGVVSVVVFFWLLASFIAELHGFASRGAVLAAVFVASFGLALMLVTVLMLIFGPEAFQRV
jgi:Yip1 domain